MRISASLFSQHRTPYTLSYENKFGQSRVCRERDGNKKGVDRESVVLSTFSFI